MGAYVARRLLGIIPVLLGVSVAVFLVLQLIPGDPAVMLAGVGASGEEIERIRQQLGLDQNLFVQYSKWLKGILVGDWGVSIASREPILPLLLNRFQSSLVLAAAGMAGAVLLSVPLGVVAALYRNKLPDFLLTVIALLGISAPIFWVALLLQLTFAVGLRWLPATGNEGIASVILPAIALAANSAGIIMRMTRSSMLEVIGQEYVRTARAKGLPGRVVVFRHALKNAMIPVTTVIGLQSAYLMGGAVLTETVFVWPGIGKLMVDSIFRRDLPVVQGAILLTGLAFIVVNVLTELACAMLDPRVRYE